MEKQKTVVNAAMMKEIEKAADEGGLSYYQMMENAGTAAWNIIKENFPAASRILIFAGKGNNGGDGLVVARLAALEGKAVAVILAEGEPVTEDAAKNYLLLKELCGDKDIKIEEVVSPEGGGTYVPKYEASGPDAIVDAIYGTGFHGALRPTGAACCAFMNRAKAPVISLDIPSGLNCDTGEAAEGAVKACITISFHALKPVHVMEGKEKHCGEVLLAGIGIN